jgi:hypothetical protein
MSTTNYIAEGFRNTEALPVLSKLHQWIVTVDHKRSKWRLAVELVRNGERTKATGTIDVARTTEVADSHWSLIAIPPLIVVPFVARERLILRKAVMRCATS